jgi:hypothetical protein
MPAPATRPSTTLPAAADVVLDTRVDQGALYFVLACSGPGAAHAVRARFSRTIRDLAGQRVNDNPLFSRLEFLAPGRRIDFFVDALAGYLKRRQPMRFEVRLDWRTDDGQAGRRTLTHDLTAWTQLRQSL